MATFHIYDLGRHLWPQAWRGSAGPIEHRPKMSAACFAMASAALVANLLAFSQTAAAQDRTASLTIRIENVSAQGGILRLGLYDRAAYPDNDSKPAAADVKAQPGETVVTLKNLAPGVYAIETYQDINANGRLDTSWIGLPLEPFGFSHDAKPFLGKPGFDQVKFTLMPGENTQTLHLRNFSS